MLGLSFSILSLFIGMLVLDKTLVRIAKALEKISDNSVANQLEK